jgi:glucose/mannose-6-phosphate isomerase
MAETLDILDRPSDWEAIDRSSMASLIDKLPSMFAEGWAAGEDTNIPTPDKIDNIVIAGMGGSAISGDIVAMALKNKVQFPITVNRGYVCPSYAGKNTLFIALSYSGNTEETISAYKEAHKKGAFIVSVSNGGELEVLSKKNKVPHVIVPKGLPPRAALGYLLSALLSILSKVGVCPGIKTDLDAAVKLMMNLQRKWGPNISTRDNDVKQLALKLKGKVPVILGSVDTTYAAAQRWKTQMNENSKMTVLFNVFPELNHNDMVNFSSLKNGHHEYSFVILRDDTDVDRMKRRIEITKSLISGAVGGFQEVWSLGESSLEHQLSLILFGDYLSLYLAIVSDVDPTPVDIIEKLKKELAR